MKTTKKLIEELQILLEIANDSKKGYVYAIENTEVPELKILFSKYALERASNAIEIKEKIQNLGGTPNNQPNSPLSTFRHTWLDIKIALNSKEIKAIINTVITGERSAVEAYDKVLVNEPYTSDLYDLLSGQRFGIQKALNIIQTFSLEYKPI